MPLGCILALCSASSELLCSLTERLPLHFFLLQHHRLGEVPSSTHLPDWMERFCPTYFISWGGPWSHRQRAAHASASRDSCSSHTWPGGKERGRQGFWLLRRGKRRSPLLS